MKKVRKSLALDVVDCQLLPTHKRKCIKTEDKHTIKVKRVNVSFISIPIDLIQSGLTLLGFFPPGRTRYRSTQLPII